MVFKKYKCKKCGDIVQSKYSGHYCACKCGAIAVDQTEYYGRFIGDPDNIEEVVDNESVEQKKRS